MNIRGLHSNSVGCESSHESNSPNILALLETNLEVLIDSGNFSVTGYLPLTQTDSLTHMHDLGNYVKEGLPLKLDLSLGNSAVWNTIVTSGLVPQLLLGIIRQTTKMNIQDCWSFTFFFSLTFDYGQLKSFLQVFLQNWLIWFHFLLLVGGLQVILIDCMTFLSPFQDVTSNVYVTSFFPCIAMLWNSLPIECFPLTCNLNGITSRNSRHLLTVGFLQKDFLYAITFLCFFFL